MICHRAVHTAYYFTPLGSQLLLFQVRPHGQHDHTEGGPASETSLWTNSKVLVVSLVCFLYII